MPRIRTIVLAALCGIPGPAIVTMLTLVAYGGIGGGWESGLAGLVQVAVTKIRGDMIVVIIEVLLGITYGAVRGFGEPTSLLRGTLKGASVWLLTGLLLIYILLCFPTGPPASHAFGLYCEHVAAGAIAGLHVEFYLLCTRSKRKEPVGSPIE